MLTRIPRKPMVALVGALAFLVIAASTALAAQFSHGFPSSSIGPTPSVTGSPEKQEIGGVIQSIDQGKHTFTLLPVNQTKTVTITFDTHTDMQSEDGALHLAVGSRVEVHTLERSDGSLYAKEIELASESHGSDEEDGSCVFPSGTRTPGATPHDDSSGDCDHRNGSEDSGSGHSSD